MSTEVVFPNWATVRAALLAAFPLSFVDNDPTLKVPPTRITACVPSWSKERSSAPFGKGKETSFANSSWSIPRITVRTASISSFPCSVERMGTGRYFPGDFADGK